MVYCRLVIVLDCLEDFFYSIQGPRRENVLDHEGGIFEFLTPLERFAIIQHLSWGTIWNLAPTSRELLYGVFGGFAVLQQCCQLTR